MEAVVHFSKKIIRQPFDSVVDNLIKELNKAGFIVSGFTDLQKDLKNSLNIDFKKYKILSVHIPNIYYSALNNSSLNGMMIPCNINVIEVYPEIVEVIPINTIELLRISLKNDQYFRFVEEIDISFTKALNALEGGSDNYPDLNTSWD